MDYPFIVKLIISFIAGGLWMTGGIALAEGHGTKSGGLFIGLPSTLLISLLFIGWTQSTEVAVAATTIVPITNGVNCLFVVTYTLLVRYGFWRAMSSALLVWIVLSLSLASIGFNNFILSIVAYFASLCFSLFVIEKILKIKSESGREVKYGLLIILLRGFCGGTVIVLAILLAKVGGPLFGGVFAMFPAMFLGTVFITHSSHGALFSVAVIKSSMLGALSCIVYIIGVRYFYPSLGLWIGTLFALTVSYGFSLALHQFIAKKIS